MTYKETLEKALKFCENKAKTYEGYSPINTAAFREGFQKSADMARRMIDYEEFKDMEKKREKEYKNFFKRKEWNKKELKLLKEKANDYRRKDNTRRNEPSI